MKSYFLPDYFFDDIYQITPAFLQEHNIHGLILDIDNTLVTYDDPEPTESVQKWIGQMQEKQIQLSFVSNNHAERVTLFNQKLQFFASSGSAKPSRKQLRKAMESMQLSPAQTAVVGDQIFTDILAAKRVPMMAILVKPIKDKTSWFFCFKRWLEKPFLRAYYKKNAK